MNEKQFSNIWFALPAYPDEALASTQDNLYRILCYFAKPFYVIQTTALIAISSDKEGYCLSGDLKNALIINIDKPLAIIQL